MIIEKIILFSVLICMIQYYMFMTNVVWEYINLISKIFPCKNFFNGVLLISAAKNETNYIQYINSIYRNFFTKLISCPICIGFWMSVIASVFCGNVLLFAPIAYISLCLYFLIKILTNKSSMI